MKTHIDLCSGIGGFALAARWSGYTTTAFCEIDPWCQRVLRHHWPEVPIHDDLRTFDPAGVREPVTLLTAGYPCQPFSVAGNRGGEDDDRHLWPDIVRILDGVRPARCLFENVVGHISMGIDTVLADLAARGYATGAVVIPAGAVEAPHRRDRVWILADRAGVGVEGLRGLADPDRPDLDPAALSDRGGADDGTNRRGTAESGLGTADDGLSRWLARRGLIPWWRPCSCCDDLWCLRCACHVFACQCGDVEEEMVHLDWRWTGDPLAAFAPDWEQGVPRVTMIRRPSDKARLHALGNAIVPQVAYMILAAWDSAWWEEVTG